MEAAGLNARLSFWCLGFTNATDSTLVLMTYLTQQDIEKLSPEEYCRFLAYGDIELIDDDEFSDEYHRILRHLVEFDL